MQQAPTGGPLHPEVRRKLLFALAALQAHDLVVLVVEDLDVGAGIDERLYAGAERFILRRIVHTVGINPAEVGVEHPFSGRLVAALECRVRRWRWSTPPSEAHIGGSRSGIGGRARTEIQVSALRGLSAAPSSAWTAVACAQPRP